MLTAQVRKDAGESIFFQRQLEWIEQKVYLKKYPEHRAREFFPVSNEGGPGVTKITYRMYERVGIAQAIQDYAKDFKRVNLRANESSAKVQGYGEAIEYSKDEADAARFANVNLDTALADTARYGYEELVEQVAAKGDPSTGLLGFNTNPNVPIYAAATGVGGFLWSQKTPDEIVTDISTLMSSIPSLTNDVEAANTVLLDPGHFELILRLRLPNTLASVLSYVQETNPGVEFRKWSRMKAAGVGGVGRMAAYTKDPDKIELREPEPFKIYPFQQIMLLWRAPAYGRVAGIVFRYPLSAAFLDGI
jgi:hypothetical protein